MTLETRLRLDILLDILFPTECLCCESPHEYVCYNCMKNCIEECVNLVCSLCREKSLLGSTHPKCKTTYNIDGIFAGSNFSNSLVKILIKRLKYKNAKKLAPYLAQLICMRLKENFLNFTDSTNLYITPIPLHIKRKKARGYNQSQLLAQEISKQLNLPYLETLKRRKNTKDQTKLSKEQRYKNVENAFSLLPSVGVKNKNFFLIDDVYTTGSTLKEAAKALKRNGANLVWGIAMAKD